MKEFEYTITDELGIHARPAGILVKEVKKYESAITVSVNGKSTNAKGIVGVMSLAAKKGNVVKVSAEGADEEAAIAGLKDFFESNL